MGCPSLKQRDMKKENPCIHPSESIDITALSKKEKQGAKAEN